MLAAAAGPVPELVWLYVALIQIPIYALPLIMKPLLRRLAPRSTALTFESNAQVRRRRREPRLKADQLLQQVGEVRRFRVGRASFAASPDAAGVVISTFVHRRK